MGASKESISKFIGNKFHVKVGILSPEFCNHRLRMERWKSKV